MQQKSQKQLKLGETIKRIVAEVFLRDDRVKMKDVYLTVLRADVSPDGKNVKIFINILGDEKLRKEVIKKLNEMAPYLRSQIAKKMITRSVPEISFLIDSKIADSSRIEELINSEAKRFDGEEK